MNTEYRKAQFLKIETVYSEFPTKIKIIKPNGETHWMDITEQELAQIKELLTEACKNCHEPLYTVIRAHYHTENGVDVTE